MLNRDELIKRQIKGKSYADKLAIKAVSKSAVCATSYAFTQRAGRYYGPVTDCKLTLKVQLPLFPVASVAVQLTRVEFAVNEVPEMCVQETVGDPTLSEDVVE